MSNNNKNNKTDIKNICVFCGSSPGKDSNYLQAAENLGKEFGKQGLNLVYGGGNVGLMGAVSQNAHDSGSHVTGIIPNALKPREVSGHTLGTEITVSSMHERKALMNKKSDAFIALPGGYGTFEELMEVITWQQLGIHDKPIGLLNINGFYDPLLEFFRHSAEEGFIKEKYTNIVVAESTPEKLIDKLKEHQAPEGLTKWLNEEES
eukprot:gb/GECH01007990.1/.p1 GENE.gb/GECH01007990.1/~~gb/GECH01007990.1/.p1  ORF type:complete len:206 (+),score=65.52 gb/GECH01007990.1/:1-618(+)